MISLLLFRLPLNIWGIKETSILKGCRVFKTEDFWGGSANQAFRKCCPPQLSKIESHQQLPTLSFLFYSRKSESNKDIFPLHIINRLNCNFTTFYLIVRLGSKTISMYQTNYKLTSTSIHPKYYCRKTVLKNSNRISALLFSEREETNLFLLRENGHLKGKSSSFIILTVFSNISQKVKFKSFSSTTRDFTTLLKVFQKWIKELTCYSLRWNTHKRVR